MEPSPDCAAFIQRFNLYLEESEKFLLEKGLNRHMEFIWAVEGLREKDEKESPPFIRKIYNSYCHHINLSERVQINIENRIASNKYALDIFDAAVDEVWRFLDLIFVSEFPLPPTHPYHSHSQQQQQFVTATPSSSSTSTSNFASTIVKLPGNNLQNQPPPQPHLQFKPLQNLTAAQPMHVVENPPVAAIPCVQDQLEDQTTTSELDETLINPVDNLPTNPSQPQTFSKIEQIQQSRTSKNRTSYEMAQELTERLVSLKRERQGFEPSYEVILWERELKLERHKREEKRALQRSMEMKRQWQLDQEKKLRRKEKEERLRKRLSEKHTMQTCSGRDLASLVRAQFQQNLVHEDVPPDDILDDHLSRCWSDFSPERFSPPTRLGSSRHSRSTGGVSNSSRADSLHVNVEHRPPPPPSSALCNIVVNKEPAHSRMSKSQTFPNSSSSNSRHNNDDSGISTITMSTSTSRTTRDEDSSMASHSANHSAKNKKKDVTRVYYQDIL